MCPMELSTGQNPIIEKNVMRGERPLKKLGVIAGMGPMATVTFLKKIIELTDAQIDQDHINMVIEHLPSIPDRTAYILDPTKPSPLPMMLAAGRNLVKSGAEEIAMLLEEREGNFQMPSRYRYLMASRRLGVVSRSWVLRLAVFWRHREPFMLDCLRNV